MIEAAQFFFKYPSKFAVKERNRPKYDFVLNLQEKMNIFGRIGRNELQPEDGLRCRNNDSDEDGDDNGLLSSSPES
ncbi:unnamed protein product [Gongylonema pulchrum]|uniref:SURP motif domain-containing protein n=1 Tax=Gongylonema pulchrum TaxID=637853 RepID=A0A183DEU8_9BILA|nr:unnamed protein product [Gongylonema pulchrum]